MSRAEYGSDYVVEILSALGIDKVAFNPGASFRGLQDSLVNFAGGEIESILCCHEEIAVAAAHGYAKATGKPMAAVVHNIVGLQHASMAIYNAWIDRAPVFVLGATGPVDSAKRRPWIDWIHTANVQGQLVRDFVKFDDQPASIAAVGESMMRAFRAMTQEPQGPIYLNLDSALQEQAAPPGLEVPDVSRFIETTRFSPEPRATARVAELLLRAERPVIAVERLPRGGEAAAALAALAELAGAAVLPHESYYSLPTDHPLNLAGQSERLLAEADVVIMLDTRRLVAPERSDCTVVRIGVADLGLRSWSHDFGRLQATDLDLIADPFLALEAIAAELRAKQDAKHAEAARQRVRELGRLHAVQRSEWKEHAFAAGGASPISSAYLAAVLGEKIASRDFVLAFKSYAPWPLRLWELDQPAQYPGPSGGGGVGYGIGATIGVALAHRGSGKLIVDVQPDGDLLYCTSALWTLAQLKLPVLIVMDNNRSLGNSEQHAVEIARARGRPVDRAGIGTHLRDPAVDFATLARGFGLHGEGPISDPGQLGPALDRALAALDRSSGPVLVDVVTGS